MSDSVQTIDKPTNDLDKLASLFNEEIYLRVEPHSIPVTKFKILDDLLEFYKSKDKIEEARIKILEHIKEHPESISASYLLGMLSLIQNKVEDFNYLKILLDIFKQNSKWTIIEYISDRIIHYGDQRMALKYKAEALEKLNKNKELKIVLEKLAKHDRKNPEIAKKYGLSILEDDKVKAIQFLKQAAETFARNKDYVQLEEIWPIIIQSNFEDYSFFEKIERTLVGNREKTRLVILFFPLIEIFKQLEDLDKTILYLKKVLEYEPQSQKARTDLIKVYKQKYANHSLLEDFLKMSEIGNNKKPIILCINNFERNIVFDTNNYVMHRSWGVGKIQSISSETDSIIVDFQDKKAHKLSIQMAINSLKPLKKDHIWVRFYENKDEINKLFEEDVATFIAELLKSYDFTMVLPDIKSEIIGKFLKKSDDWTKWWNKTKILLKKDPRIGFNPKKKDELIYRHKPMTLAEELTDKFNAQTEFNKKIEIALEALEEPIEAESAIESFNHFFYEEELNKDNLKKILAYLYLDKATTVFNPEDVPRNMKPDEIGKVISSLTEKELVNLSKQISNIDLKKDYVNLIKKYHPDYVKIFGSILYEVPVKINKYVFTLLVNDNRHGELNSYVNNVISKPKENAELFIWLAKSILTGSWNYTWLNVSNNDLALRIFRILKPLAKIEEKGTKLKNSASEILFGNKNAVISEVIKTSETEFIRKIYALFKEVPYIADSEKEKLLNLIHDLKPDFNWEDSSAIVEEDREESHLPQTGIIVTQVSFNNKKEEFEHLVNVEMAENSRDIGEAQEKGDLRENAEYKAAMEKQVQLQALAKKMDAELKSAKVIDLSKVKTSKVNIGCTVQLLNIINNETISYSILGPWDADTEKNIISYLSPLGKSLLGKKVDDVAKIDFEGNQMNFKVLEINQFSPA